MKFLSGVSGLAILLAFSTLCGCMPPPPEKAVEDAEQAAVQGNWEKAAELAEEALEAGVEATDVKTFKAYCQYQAGKAEDALSNITDLASGNPEHFMTQYFAGWLLVKEKAHGEALQPLRRAQDLEPQNSNVLVLLVRCCLAQNLREEGMDYIAKLKKQPEFADKVEIDNAAGLLAVKHGKYQEAKQWFQKALDRDDTNTVVLQNMAVLFDQYMRKPQKARKYYAYCLSRSQQMGDSRRAERIKQRLKQLAGR